LAKERTSTGLRRLHAFPKARFSVTLIVLAMLTEAAFHAQLPFSAGLLVDRAIGGKDRDALALILGALLCGFAAALAAGILRDGALMLQSPKGRRSHAGPECGATVQRPRAAMPRRNRPHRSAAGRRLLFAVTCRMVRTV